MAYKLNRRRFKKIINRLRKLPGGINFFRYLFNKLHGFFLTASRSTKVPYPSSIMFEVTNHCNLGCITCPREYAFGHAMAKGSIDLDKMKKVIDEVAPYIDSIGLTGLGETLLYKKLEETLAYIKSKNKGIQTFVSTNAHIPGAENYIEKLAPYLDTVQISIDGTENIYEVVRLKSNYNFFIDMVKKIVKLCKEHHVAVMFNFVAVKENYHQMKDIVKLASELGVDDVNITPVNIASITTLDLSYYDIFYGDDFKNELKAAYQLSHDVKNVNLTVWDIKSKNEFQKCHLVWNHFYVSWDGYMTPCCAKPFPKELNFGNVFETSMMESLNSKEYRQFRELWYRNEPPDFCKNCHLIDLKPIDINFEPKLN